MRLPQAPVQDDRAHPRPAGRRRVPHVGCGGEAERDECVVVRRVRAVPHARLHRRLLHVRPHRLHRHDASPPGATCAPRPRPRRVRLPAALEGRVPHRRRRRHVHRRPRPARRHDHHHDLPEHGSAILIGFGFGGSLLALFLRVGGGIFTKAADVGADLVGKVEAGIPEDDPRNPATIADNVGDNVGDCAGMAADLFESYEVTLVASIILGVAAFQLDRPRRPEQVGARADLPARLPAPSACSRRSSASSRCGRPTKDKSRDGADQPRLPHRRHPHRRRHRSLVALVYVGNDEGTLIEPGLASASAPSSIGLVLAQVVSRLTEYFTSTETRRCSEIAEAARTGPATTVLVGHPVGPRVVGVRHHRHRRSPSALRIALGGGNLQFSLYLVALTGMGMLATTGVIVSEDTFGPVADNAAGIAEMSGEFEGEPERIMVSLDAVGNTTKAVTKGFAIGSAVIAAVALFASLHRDDRRRAQPRQGGRQRPVPRPADADQRGRPEDVHRPAHRRLDRRSCSRALAIRAVGRTAGVVVQEVRTPVRRRQDHERREAARLRPGHRHLHRGLAARARHAGAARRAHAGHHRLRHQLPRPRRVPRRRHPHRPADGQLPVELRWRVGQRQEVHRGRPRGRQGLRGPQGRRHRRHRRRPVQGHRRPGAQPAHQGDEPGVAADPAGDHQPAGQRQRPLHRSPAVRWSS